MAGTQIDGNVVARDEQQIVLRVKRSDGEDVVSSDEAIVMRSEIAATKVQRGNHSRTGALVGLAFDAAAIVALVVIGNAWADALDDSDNHH